VSVRPFEPPQADATAAAGARAAADLCGAVADRVGPRLLTGSARISVYPTGSSGGVVTIAA
jgi:hypothetical protein